MELRHYWRIIARRGRTVRTTFALVALLAFAAVAYSYYNAQYLGHAVLSLQVQPEKLTNATIDPLSAANENTKGVVGDLVTYAYTRDYYQHISDELKNTFGIHQDWRSIQGGLKISNTDKAITFDWYGSQLPVVKKIVRAAVDQMEAEIRTYHQQVLSSSPPIDHIEFARPDATHISLTKPLLDFILRALIGLVLGLILAFLFEYLDDTVQDADDVRRSTGLSTLAIIHQTPARTIEGAS